MTYQRFEDLPVWQAAARLYELTDDFLAGAPGRLRPSFRDQLERAALSVSNNIAEGFERGTTNELLAFLYIARGSAGEVRSMLGLLERRPWMGQFKSEVSSWKSAAEGCSRQLRGWADSLQNSPIQGQRHLTRQVRERERVAKAASAFRLNFLRNLRPDHPLYRSPEARAARGEPEEPEDRSPQGLPARPQPDTAAYRSEIGNRKSEAATNQRGS